MNVGQKRFKKVSKNFFHPFPFPFLLDHAFETKILRLGVSEKNSYFVVNPLVELLNIWFYRAYEKEVVAPTFSTEKLFRRIPYMVLSFQLESFRF